MAELNRPNLHDLFLMHAEARGVLVSVDPADTVFSVHEGVTRDEAIAGCGFPLDAPAIVPVTERPPPEAIKLLREEIDPHAMRRLETREGRAEALRELEAMS